LLAVIQEGHPPEVEEWDGASDAAIDFIVSRGLSADNEDQYGEPVSDVLQTILMFAELRLPHILDAENSPIVGRATLEQVEIFECACCGAILVEDTRGFKTGAYAMFNASNGKLHGSDFPEGYCA